MSANRERPGVGTGASSLAGDNLSIPQAAAVSGLTRRRDAARRLPPLPSGRRDPLFPWGEPVKAARPTGPSRSPIRVEFDSPHNVALVRGFGGGDFCRLVGGRGTWVEARRGWVTSIRTARDVISAVERDGRPLVITEAEVGR